MPNPVSPYYFISYSRKDQRFVKKLAADLDSHQVSLWVDWGQIEGGESWTQEIEEGIGSAEGFLLVLTPDSVDSQIVRKEITVAHQKGKKIIPLLLKPCQVPLLVNDLHYLDFTQGYTEKFPELLQALSQGGDPSKMRRFSFGLHHQFTCDRSSQYAQFVAAFSKRKKSQKNAFFYFHGGDRQAHEGLFRRFIHRLRGEDHPKDYLPPGYQVKDFRVQFPDLTDKEGLMVEVPRNLFRAWKIPEVKMERILNKDLSFSLEQSPVLKGMSRADKVCVLFSLDHMYWDKEGTRDVVRWFVKEFCLEGYEEDARGYEREKELLTQGPDFLFFFALEYDAEENPGIKEEIEAEVQEALKESEHVVSLPVLDMVAQKDIRFWFKKYRDCLPEKMNYRSLYTENFEGKEPEMYMEDVQSLLKKVITQINEPDKHRPRHT